MASTALKRAFNTIKDTIAVEFTSATRLISELPSSDPEHARQLVVEGHPNGKGSWNLYIQTKMPDGRAIQDLTVIPKTTEQILKAVASLYDNNITLPQYHRAQYLSNIRAPLLKYSNLPAVTVAP